MVASGKYISHQKLKTKIRPKKAGKEKYNVIFFDSAQRKDLPIFQIHKLFLFSFDGLYCGVDDPSEVHKDKYDSSESSFDCRNFEDLVESKQLDNKVKFLIPEAIRKDTTVNFVNRSIQVYDEKFEDGEFNRVNVRYVDGSYNILTNVITVSLNVSSGRLTQVILHEFCHKLWHKHFSEWEQASILNVVPFGKSLADPEVVGEIFAESCAFTLLGRLTNHTY